jgi:hypothetical protein
MPTPTNRRQTAIMRKDDESAQEITPTTESDSPMSVPGRRPKRSHTTPLSGEPTMAPSSVAPESMSCPGQGTVSTLVATEISAMERRAKNGFGRGVHKGGQRLVRECSAQEWQRRADRGDVEAIVQAAEDDERHSERQRRKTMRARHRFRA